jgi:rfaE bifunctional protein nucleotidyltransferase chain/domain
MKPRVIYTAGCFDLLHAGHINLLWQSKQLGDVLVVGVVSDVGARAYKGRLPMENCQQRMQAIARLGFVDVVILQKGTDPTTMLERFQPAAMVHGDDWTELREGHDALERLGVEWVTIPYTPGISTTLLREVA